MSNSVPIRSRFSLRINRRLAFFSLCLLVIAPVFFVSTSQAIRKKAKASSPIADQQAARTINSKGNYAVAPVHALSALLPQAPPSPDLVETFADDCTTPKTAFVLGDTVCAKVSGGPSLSFYPRRISIVDNSNVIQQNVTIATDPQTQTFTLPTNQVGGPDNRGVWRVNSINTRSSVRASAFFTVSDPQNPAADQVIYNSNDVDGLTTAGSNVQFVYWFANHGPDAATAVTITSTTPANTTFLSGNSSDPSIVCTFPEANSSGGSTSCTVDSVPAGGFGKVTVIVNVNTGLQAGTVISDVAQISSTTGDPFTDSNSATSTVNIVAGAATNTCTLQCPDNMTAIANTTENSQRGAHVTFDSAIATGDCGTVTATPASGSFFPVGDTTVNVTSETGGGSCSFIITVEDTGSNPPAISCPASQQTTADSDCVAAVYAGTATATGDNVTLFATRSDGKPMYTCDANGTNCTRNSTDVPYPAGTTTITWIARSHDVAGPYASEDDEIAHRTGASSCTQTIRVDDVTPPSITAPANQTASADANCTFTLPDYTAQASVSDNCGCDSNTEDCQGRQPITITQSPAPGTVVGLGTTQITLTANDGSSNNGGAGNTATAQFNVVVNDTTPPAISCPASIVTSTDPGLCSATVNPGTATATDNCDTSVTINGTRSDNQPLNAPYPKGTTTIHWTATDDANNSSSCDQTVTVNDTEAPSISCPANITKSNDAGICGAVVTYSTPVGQDNCPGATTAQTAGLPSGSTFPVGTTTNTFQVTDASGNKTSCSFTVTVNDTENPVISCPVSQTLEPTCPSGAVGNWTPPVGTDNCPGAVTTRTAGPAPGTVFAAGSTTTITYTVNDAHGNSASCSFTVTVKTIPQTIQDMKTYINGLGNLSGTQKQGLNAKLDAALSGYNNGQTNVACNKLADFISQVQAYINNGTLTSAQGNSLLSSANHLRNAIGCTSNPCT